jgi:hypothetical protein
MAQHNLGVLYIEGPGRFPRRGLGTAMVLTVGRERKYTVGGKPFDAKAR